MTENLFQIRVEREFLGRVRIGHLVMGCSKKYVVSCDDGDANPSCSDPFSDGRQGEIIYISPWGAKVLSPSSLHTVVDECN